MAETTETRITDWLAARKDAMVDLLREVVNIDSGSYDKAGVDAVGARFERFFAEQGISSWREHHDVYGDAIHALVAEPGSNEKPILLMGHRDTVFPKGETSRRPFSIEGGRAHGPGVADMKAGLVMNVFVAAAFKALGGAPCPIRVLITSDEEIASPSSRPIIEREGRASRAVYNSEPGRPSGNVTTGRKGGVFMRFDVYREGVHSGGNFTSGISAIGELAHKIVQIHALTDLDKGITLNVGLVSGGQSVNTTAPHAEGQIDLRYIDPADRARTLDAIRRIIDTPTVAGTTAKLEIKGEFLPRGADAGSQGHFRGLPGGGARRRADLARRRVLGGLCQIRFHRQRRHADHLRCRAGRRQRPHRRGVSRDRQHRAARPGPGAGDPANPGRLSPAPPGAGLSASTTSL